MNTKSVHSISINETLLNHIIEQDREERIQENIEYIKGFVEDITEFINTEWIRIENKKVYYIASKNLIIADSNRWTCSRLGFEYQFDGYKGRAMTKVEARELFYERKGINPLIKNNKIINIEDSYAGATIVAALENNSEMGISLNGENVYWGFHDLDTVKIPVRDITNVQCVLEGLIANNLIPSGLGEEGVKTFEFVKRLYDKNIIEIKNNTVRFTSTFENMLNKDQVNEIDGLTISKKGIIDELEKGDEYLVEQSRQLFVKQLLECDTLRAKIEPYDIKRLEDPNLGHWDLWSEESNGAMELEINDCLIGRNPLIDIKEDGIVGIDFGTKSTIVVYQDGDDNTQPMRIGRGDFSKKVRSEDYENPTVMEFINLEHFLELYSAREGRPFTLWEDLTISHTAANSLLSVNTKSNEYYSFFNDLKQWTGDKTRQIRLKDKKGHERVLPAFVEIEEGDFNPIEIYAYYLGLFINNMYKGIYLNYILSFPVTYEKEVREKIITSFEKGLKKSLPLEVLQDEESMRQFRVLQGASEPAAYAICALQEYGFEPEDDEKVFYGIFDFGGGTTDFDFGIWQAAEPGDRRYDYVINHFGAGGDKYLGGENLLELLAFEVFKANQDKLIEEKITFYKPTECKAFAGSEVLISESQEAKLNTKQLMEKLRPLWEEHEDYQSLYANGVIKVTLFDKSGEPKLNFELDIDMEALRNILVQRIEKGVKNFFEALKLTFNTQEARAAEEVIIFLAGNSSKSNIVKDLFEIYTAKYNESINGSLTEEEESEREYFTIFPPLGTAEAIKFQQTIGVEVDATDFTRPTGKTGVAYGLIEGRPGSRIKVISEQKATDEAKFSFYIGYNSRKKFKVAIDREVKYNEWHKFIDAGEIDFELYYTNLPEATTNQLPIKEVQKKICRIDEINESADVYIRAVAPSIIEYAVASDESLATGQVLGNIVRIELG